MRFITPTLSAMLLFLISASPGWAQAVGDACTSAGASVEITAGSLHTRLVCDGTVFKKMESWDNSGWREVNMGSPANFNSLTTVCNAASEGRTLYDKSRKGMLLCDGTTWKAFGLNILIGP